MFWFAVAVLGLYIGYYVCMVIERPTVYETNMSHIRARMPSLQRSVRWTIFAVNAYIQFAILSITDWYEDYVASKLYTVERFDEIVIAWGLTKNEQTLHAVLLFVHTVYGSYVENAAFACGMRDIGFLPVSYSRRGHSQPLKTPRFNTVGCQKDLMFVIGQIKCRYPFLPIYAIGSSAGSSLLARYAGNKDVFAGIVLVSPGYDFEESQTLMPTLASRIAAKKAKRFFLEPNKSILEAHDKKAFEAMAAANTMNEWHEYQWRFAGSTSKQEYYSEHNPAHVLHTITIPALYITALDDIAFPASLTEKFKRLVDKCPSTMIVHTKRGSHLGFFEGLIPRQWSLKVAKEFLLAVHSTHYKSARAA